MGEMTPEAKAALEKVRAERSAAGLPTAGQSPSTFAGQLEKIRRERSEAGLPTAGVQPVSRAEPDIKDPTEREYVYEGEILGKQLTYLRRWASERGARIEEHSPMTTREGTVWQYRIVSSRDLLEGQRQLRAYEEKIFRPTKMQAEVGGFTPTEQLITRVPSVEAIERKEREAMIQTVAAEKARTEGVVSRLSTILSPSGYEYIGAAVSGKDPTAIVQRKIEKDIKAGMTGEKTADTFIRGVVEAAQSPVVEVETAFLAGAGFVALGATAIGAKVLAMPVVKAAVAAGGVYYVGTTGYEAYADITMGNVDRGIGRALTTAVSLGAAFAGAKAQAGSIAAKTARIKTEIQTAKTEGVSISTPEVKAEPGRMAGVFETSIKVGKKDIPVRGIIIGVSRATGKARAIQQVIIKIPKQKFGRITIQETTLVRTGPIAKTGKGMFTVKASEGVIASVKPGKVDIVLAGTRRGTAYYIERGKIARGKDVLRLYTGTGYETAGRVSVKDVKAAARLVYKDIPAGKIGDVPRTDVRMAGIQDIRWVDIAKPAPAGIPAVKPIGKGMPGFPSKPVKGVAPALKVTDTPKPVAPTGKLSVAGPREALGLPTFTVTATVSTAAITGTVARTARELRPAAATAILKVSEQAAREEVTALKSAARAAEILVPTTRTDVDVILKPVSVQEEIIGQATRTRPEQALALKQVPAQKAKTTEVSVPAIPPSIPVIETLPPVIIGRLPGALRLGEAGARVTTYKTRVVVNPIPATLDIKMPKIKGV